jgi:shikimate dehydrogenase
MRLNIDTKFIFLLGDPLRQSVAGIVYNRYFESAGDNILYIPIEVHSESDFEKILTAVRVMNFAGLGVTKPYKVSIMRYLDDVDPIAQAIGSCNTVVFKDGCWRGYNTDGTGALRSLTAAGFDPSGAEIFCFGAGGTARSVCFTLASAGALKITLCSRSSLCEELAAEINRFFPGVCGYVRSAERSRVTELAKRCPLVMNLSGVGMGKHLGETPADSAVFAPGKLAFDAIYGPSKSRFLADAEAAGASILNGFPMFVGQAARQIEIWTGIDDPTNTIKRILEDVLK